MRETYHSMTWLSALGYHLNRSVAASEVLLLLMALMFTAGSVAR
jgi:hypothetical protein